MAVQRIKTPVNPIEVPPVGKFIKYYASIAFNIGIVVNNTTQNLQISMGDEIEYNGGTIRYNGSLYSSPSFKGTIMRGWVSTEKKKSAQPAKDVKVQPKSQVQETKKPNHFSTNVENQEETVVGDYKDIRKIEKAVEVESMDDGDVVAKIGKSTKSTTVVSSNTDHLKKIREIEGERPNLVKVHPNKSNVVREIESEAKTRIIISDTGSEKKVKKEAKKEAKKKVEKSAEDKKVSAEAAAKKRAERLASIAASEAKVDETPDET